MGALMFSLAGVSMHMKGAAWAGVICATGAVCNKRAYDADWKQVLMGVMFSLSALFVNGMNAYQGMKVREAEAGLGGAGAETIM